MDVEVQNIETLECSKSSIKKEVYSKPASKLESFQMMMHLKDLEKQ
jgi:hypothetical protein